VVKTSNIDSHYTSLLSWWFGLYSYVPSRQPFSCYVAPCCSLTLIWTWGAGNEERNIANNVLETVKSALVNLSSGTPPPCSKNVSTRNRFRQEALARTDLLYDENEKLVKHVPLGDERLQTNYNFKVRVKVETDNEVLAELDSDSHISLITEEYFRCLQFLGPLEVLPEDPVSFEGLGSRIQTKFLPIMLNVQIGKVLLRDRFIVTEHLSSSALLSGTDFFIRNSVSIAPHSSGSWFVHVGPIDNPIGKVQALVTNKINLCSDRNLQYKPFEIKKITVSYKVPEYEAEFTRNTPCYSLLKPSEGLKLSLFQLLEDETGTESTIKIVNESPMPSFLPAGLEIASAELDLRAYQVKSEKVVPEVIPMKQVSLF
jgi:hypothetical protein